MIVVGPTGNQHVPSDRPYRRCIVVGALLVVHAGMLGFLSCRTSPSLMESAHMAAGLYTWNTLKFDVFDVNPPLVRVLATAPVVMCDPQYDWKLYSPLASDRCERQLGSAFCEANGERAIQWYFPLARWACIPFCLLGAYMCYSLAGEIFGQASGLCALVLWCFSPTLLGLGATICPDSAAAAMGVTAVWGFRRWLLVPNWPRAFTSGILLGLLPLTKLTWIIAFPLWPVLWLVWRFRQEDSALFIRELAQLGTVLVVALHVTNLGYIYDGSFRPLGDYEFVSKTLGGVDDSKRESPPITDNRFAGTWLGKMPVPLPASMIQGIDTQRYDFEWGLPSYLRGEWSDQGWWYYYLYALAVKVPLGMCVLVGLAIGVSFLVRGYCASRRDEMVVLAPFLVILIFVSSQTGFSHHLRYVLPIFPFAFIWMSKIARAFEFGHRKLAAVVVVAMAWSVGSSLWVYPYSLSYFNELAGGPKNGHAHLLNSNIDWGQDLLYLKRWLEKHPEAKPLHLAFNGAYDASIAGIEYTLPPTEPQPGWHALSVNKIRSRTKEYEYFLKFEPVAMAGYSIYIYHITLDEANRVRKELGLPELPEDWQSPERGDHG